MFCARMNKANQRRSDYIVGSDDLEFVDILLTSLARHINENLTVTLGGNARKRDTLAIIDENRVVNPKDLEKQPCHENYFHISGGESSCNAKFNIAQPMDQHNALDQLKWSIESIQEPFAGTSTCHSSNEISTAAVWPALSDYSYINIGSTTTWPLSPTMGSSSENAIMTEPKSPLTSASQASESHSMRPRPNSCHRTIDAWTAPEETCTHTEIPSYDMKMTQTFLMMAIQPTMSSYQAS
jgi:hypothetical protein